MVVEGVPAAGRNGDVDEEQVFRGSETGVGMPDVVAALGAVPRRVFFMDEHNLF